MKKLILILFTTIAFSQTQYKTIVIIKRVLPTTTVDLLANKKYAADLKQFNNNDEALNAGLKVDEWYRLPTINGKILISIVVPREVAVGNGSIENTTIYMSKEFNK
jgi:hypothetical protein